MNNGVKMGELEDVVLSEIKQKQISIGCSQLHVAAETADPSLAQ